MNEKERERERERERESERNEKKGTIIIIRLARSRNVLCRSL